MLGSTPGWKYALHKVWTTTPVDLQDHITISSADRFTWSMNGLLVFLSVHQWVFNVLTALFDIHRFQHMYGQFHMCLPWFPKLWETMKSRQGMCIWTWLDEFLKALIYSKLTVGLRPASDCSWMSVRWVFALEQTSFVFVCDNKQLDLF